MAVKKKAELGPKAKLMKKNVDQLKRQAKKLKVQNYSTKKKEQLVNSIMMAEARAKRKPGTKRKKAAPKSSAVKSVSTRVTMKGSRMKRMVKKRGAMPDRVMKNPARNATRRPNKPMMADVAYAQFNDFGYIELREASDLLRLYSLGAISDLARDYFTGPYGISIGFNNMSGNVFLVDEDFNVLMDAGGQLDLFISTPYSGEEGFYDDLMEIYNELHPEDQEYLDSLK
jgi:hypothetical protein